MRSHHLRDVFDGAGIESADCQIRRAAVTGINISYSRWALGAIVPGIVSLIVMPLLLYKIFPPEIKHTPAASEFAAKELAEMGPMKQSERLMLLVFALTAIALDDDCAAWNSLYGCRAAWHLRIAVDQRARLGRRAKRARRVGCIHLVWRTGANGRSVRRIRNHQSLRRDGMSGFTAGWAWWAALAVLLLIYFYAHYGFASITAHATAMYTPFLVVILAAGAPAYVAVLLLAYCSNLMASLTHYGTTPGPIYFGAGYVKQQTWWRLGLIASVPNILVWATIGLLWWKLLGWW